METPKESPAACVASPGPGCWAIAATMLKEESDVYTKTVTRRLLAMSAFGPSKEAVIGAEVQKLLDENDGFAIEAIVASEVNMPNPAIQTRRDD